jgi:hypothetical protein
MRRAKPIDWASQRSPFRRERLPQAMDYYRSQNLVLIGRGEWRSAVCPFHDDTRPSLSVNIKSGAYRCFACAAHGGDVLAFHRARYELSFQQAATALGAWEGKP